MGFMEKSVVIQKPIEEVFAQATDFKQSPRIMDAVVEVELLSDGPVKKGYQFKEVREIRGRRVPSVIEVTEYKPGERYSVRSNQQGIDLRYHYAFTQTTEGTKVSFTGELYTEGLRNKLTKPFLQMVIKKEDEDHLDHLKKFIENS
ncbi:SRPBCC family protein [Halobacillus salinarum]|uniref:SRPBCC family protein n=1 Tax=Halobacillus salinarum TaxID=2932257 RepID=A0ABY4EM43_9BACI|nr:SRPBCC family protein [Halobacillus salinarum]UOQ45151.1 SRPBCC family protein [Halobacillus salinarum]